MKMKGTLLIALLAVMVCASGCHRRADYLEPKTNNKILKNVGRVATVLFPLSMAGNILISEMVRDTERCDENGCVKDNCCNKPAAAPVVSDCGCDK